MTVVNRIDVSPRRRAPKLRLGALAALAVAGAATAWVFAGRWDEGSSSKASAPAGVAAPAVAPPRLVSASELGEVAASAGPVYWIGARRTARYELTQAPQGRVFVRYLTSASQVGSQRPDFLAIATYAQANAYAAIQAAAKRPGAVTIRPAGGGLAVYDRARPTSIFLAYPRGSHQIEVYAPSPAQARRLVATGAVTAVPLPGAPRVVTRSELSGIAARHGGLFWAGPRTPSLIELTETREGSLFVRYLSRSSEIGSPTAAYLTVATYRRPNAYATIAAAAKRRGAVAMRIPRGGLAVYDRAHPTSVYLAFPKSSRQIEVYHPDAKQARALVKRGGIVAVP
jgi:hypothetical protein